MIQFIITPPRAVINELPHIQKAYIREFQRVEGLTGDILTAKHAADKLLLQFRHRTKMIESENARMATKLIEETMSVNIMAHISEMSALECLPHDILDRIKANDPHPFFAVYDIGGEGVSTGKVDHHEERKIWSFSAIKKLAKKIKDGIAGVITGHNELDQDSKKKGGRIIHAFTKVIQDSLHAIAVAYITDTKMIDDIKDGKLDICSIEGDVILARDDPRGNWFVKDIREIRNLALGTSSIEKPGFSSAGILATVQELTERDLERKK